MRLHFRLLLATGILLITGSSIVDADIRPLAGGAFAIGFEVLYPGSPEEIFDAITGDISGWWDHSYSGKPLRLYIEPKPGGGFYEIFSESGDGALHATVITVERGKLLRFDGPLGLAGRAVKHIVTYRLEPSGPDSTRLQLEAHLAGEVDEQTAKSVEQVWRHFLIERFKPYIESGAHRKRGEKP